MAHLTVRDPSNAKELLRAILMQWSPELGDLADIAYELQLRGITDPEQLIAELEGTDEYQRIFVGIRAANGEKIMSEREYLLFRREMRSLFADNNLGDPSNALIGAIVQSRRSLRELNEDVQIMRLLEENPTMRRDFYAYTGIRASNEMLFAGLIGEAPNVMEAWQNAIKQGVVYEEFLRRRIEIDKEIGVHDDTITASHTELDRLSIEKGRTQEQYDAASTEQEGKIKERGDLNKKIADLWREIQRTPNGTKRTQMTNELNRLKGVLATLQADISKRDQSLKTLKATLDEIAGKVGKQNTAMEKASQQKATLETSLDSLLAAPPPLPTFSARFDNARRLEVLRSVQRVVRAEQGRFRTGVGGAGRIDSRPIAERETF